MRNTWRLPPSWCEFNLDPAIVPASSLHRLRIAKRNVFYLKVLGGASIEGPDGPATGRAAQRRRLALLALLAGARGRGVSRDKLVALLWPDSNVDRARAMLSDSIYRINQAVGGDALVSAGDDVRLNPSRLMADAWEFAEAMSRGDWERAVELYTGPFLDGFYLTGADEFERWAETEREAYARERARALEALATAAEGRGDADEAVRWTRMLATHDPYSSRYAVRCMRALERAGDRAAALQHARVHTLLMREELGLQPDEEVARLETELRAAPAPSRPHPRPAALLAAAPAPPSAPTPTAGPAAPAPPSVPGRGAADARGEPPGSPAPPEPGATAPMPAGVPHRARSYALPGLAALTLAIVLLVAVLPWPWARQPVEPTALAVLPFVDLSPGRDQEYFADGITEELIVRLSRLGGLNVVGRTSAFALKGSTADVREIAARLGVDAVLAGSVRRAEDRLRIVATLMDATSGYQLWSDTYERQVEDVFAIQDEIARAIAARLGGHVNGTDPASTVLAETDDPEAYNLYLRGRYEWHRRTEQGLRNAAHFFQLSTDRAPDYARAHVGLADAYAVLGFYDYLPPAEAFPRAAEAARRALQIRPDMPEAHATRGYVALYYEWDWSRAEAEFRRTIELDPSYSTGRQWYANFLTAMGRFPEATREMRAAQELDPLSLIANAALGWVLYYAGDYERAVDQCTRTLELNPDFELAYLWRGLALEELGRFDAEIADLQRAMELSGGSAITTAALARAYAVSGERGRAVELLADLEGRRAGYVPAFEVAKVHAALGHTDRALHWLGRAFEQRSHSMAFLAVDPQLASLRREPGYAALIRRAGLEHVSAR
jgi:TolB-like protein/DNA-binding SARP family transcriptional activator/Flp pilus assembly protein TadD